MSQRFPVPISSRRLWLLAALFLSVASLPVHVSSAEPETKSVRLVVDYGDGVEKHFTSLPWKAGLTVLDALHAASRHPRGLKFQHRGAGATAFVSQIDDVANEGRGRNWVYRVNGKLGDRSCALAELAAGDVVLWRFGTYQ